jgi:hypothetical protein
VGTLRAVGGTSPYRSRIGVRTVGHGGCPSGSRSCTRTWRPSRERRLAGSDPVTVVSGGAHDICPYSRRTPVARARSIPATSRARGWTVIRSRSSDNRPAGRWVRASAVPPKNTTSSAKCCPSTTSRWEIRWSQRTWSSETPNCLATEAASFGSSTYVTAFSAHSRALSAAVPSRCARAIWISSSESTRGHRARTAARASTAAPRVRGVAPDPERSARWLSRGRCPGRWCRLQRDQCSCWTAVWRRAVRP